MVCGHGANKKRGGKKIRNTKKKKQEDYALKEIMKIQKKEKTLEEIKAEHNKYSQKCKEYKSIRYTHESSRMKEEGMQYK